MNLELDQKITVDGKPAVYKGKAHHLLCFHVEGEKRIVYVAPKDVEERLHLPEGPA